MNENDKTKFAQILTGTAEVYGREVSEHAMIIFWNALKNYAIDDISMAFNRHIKNPDSGTFMPKPADIIRYLEGSNQTNSMLAWTKVSGAIATVGPHQDVVFDDPIIHQVITDMGGWIDLCSHDYKEMEFKANEFNKRYLHYKNNPEDNYPKKLTGQANVHNSSENLSHNPPVLIGDQSKAELVYQSGTDMVKLRKIIGTALKLVDSKKVAS